MFGNTKNTFGAPASTAFGQNTSLFGGAAAKSTSLFGQPSVSNTATGATVGAVASTNLPLFGSAQPQQQTLGWTGTTGLVGSGGTNLAFNPPITTDTIQRGGQSSQVNAKHMCVTAMKEYQDKSLEELRFEDYALNRRPGTTGSTSTTGTASLFGTSAAASLTNKPFQFSSTQTSSAVAPLFGQTTKPTNTLFGGATNAVTGNTLFGAATNTSTQSVFGQTAQTQAGSIFGATQPFGSSIAATATSGNLFGVGASAVGSSTGTTGFAFNQQQPTLGTGIFGVPGTTKPVTPFGTVQPATCTGLGFGTNTSSIFGLNKTANTVIGSTTPSLFGTPSVVNQQATGTAFSFGTAKPGTTAVPAANLFGTSAAKPGGIFGQTLGVSTGLNFGATQQQQPSPFSFGAPAVGSAATNTLGTGVGLFGQANVKKTLAFSAPFGTAPAPTAAGSTIFGFGQTAPAAAPAATGSLFGVPNTSGTTLGIGTMFGTGNIAATPSLFNTGTAGTTGFGFGQKPVTAGLGFGGFPVAATGLGTATGQAATGPRMFGSAGLGGSTLGTANTSGFGLGGFGTQPTLGAGVGGVGLTAYNASEQLAQSVRIQQQVLEMIRRMPYGDSPLFRNINLPPQTTTAANGTSTKTLASGALADSQTGKASKSASLAVAPVKVVANTLAERHRGAGISLGLSHASSPTGGGAMAGGRNPRMVSRNLTVTQNLLQTSNRNKLFSGFYDDNDTGLSKQLSSSSSVNGLHRSTAHGADVSCFAGGSGNNVDDSLGSFFVRRGEWRRLRLSDSLRKSILERSAASSREFSQLAEASLLTETTQNSVHFPPGDGDTVTGPQVKPSLGSGEAVPGGDGKEPVPSTTTPPASSTNNSRGVSSTAEKVPPSMENINRLRRKTVVATTSVASVASPALSGSCRTKPLQPIGITRAREALRSQPATDDSVCLDDDDLDSTWTANVTVADLDGSRTSATSPQPSAERQQEQQLSKSGVRLTRPGYYTLPSLEELDGLVDADGRCIVEDFVIGRRHYGHILFPGNTDVTGLDLDDIVHIRRREVVVFPDDEKRPPVGFGLNRVAEVCLEAVWPTDKATREPIKSSERLSIMRFEQRLERATRKMDAKFIEYRPESGSWVFEVKHFSKYRLDDSDDEAEDAHNSAPRVELPPAPPETHQIGTVAPGGDLPILRDSEVREKSGTTTLDRSDLELPAIVGSFGLDIGDRMEPDYSRELVKESHPAEAVSPKRGLPTNSVAQDLGMSPAAFRQMRSAFFSPTPAQSRRVGTFTATADRLQRFGGACYDDAVDENDEYDEYDYHLATPTDFGGHSHVTGEKKRLYDEEYYPTGVEFQRDWSERAAVGLKDNIQDSPTPRKLLCRTASPTPSTLEQKVRPQPATPFRPLPKGNPHEGAPVHRGSAHLHNSSQIRLPTFVKIPGSRMPNRDGTESPGGLYPYHLMMTKVWPRDIAAMKKSLDTKLTHFYADLSLWQGHGLRASWGLSRATGGLHQLVLLTPGLLLQDSGSSPTATPMTANADAAGKVCQPSGFFVSLNCWSPPVVEVTDEDLLNTALATSTQQFPDTTAFSAGPSLLLGSQHGRQKCAYWEPVKGLAPLESTASLLGCFQITDHVVTSEADKKEQRSARVAAISRVVALCQCLWGRHPQDLVRLRPAPTTREQGDQAEEEDGATTTCEADVSSLVDQQDDSCASDGFGPSPRLSCGMAQLSRKQAVAEWIRVQSFPWLKSRLLQLGLLDSVDAHAEPPVVSLRQMQQAPPPLQGLTGVGETNVVEGVFTCLVAGEPALGCRLALAAGLPRLASLLAQSSAGDPLVRRALHRQLIVWQQTKYDQHIPLPVLRVYSLLAGQDEFPHPKKPMQVSVLDGLDWIRVFGVHLWYLTDYSADLPEVLRAYSVRWHSDKAPTIARPLPPTVADLLDPPDYRPCANDFPDPSDTSSSDKSSFRDWPRDTAYHLLQLYRSRSHSLERTLEPTGLLVHRDASTGTVSCLTDPTGLLDWSGSWHLWRLLAGLGHRHLVPEATSQLCTEFASQLEAAGMWEWAIFVLLHLPHRLAREASVKQVLARHACLVSSRDWFQAAVLDQTQGLQPTPPLTRAEKFVIDRLGVPVRWLHEAKAILARHRLGGLRQSLSNCQLVDTVGISSASRRHRRRLQTRLFAMLEASSWLAAGHYSAAHAVCVDRLLPDVMLHTDLLLLGQRREPRPSATTGNMATSATQLGQRLSMLLEPFTLLPDSHRPPAVSTGVGIYLKYRNILTLADDLSRLYQSHAVPALTSVDDYPGKGVGGAVPPRDEEDNAEQEQSVVVTAGGEETSDDWQGRLAVTINSLHDELVSLTEQLQSMPTTSLTANVMRTEMAVMCAHLIAAFLTVDNDCSSDSGGQVSGAVHHRQLIALTNMGLPVDYRLRELRRLAELRLSIPAAF